MRGMEKIQLRRWNIQGKGIRDQDPVGAPSREAGCEIPF